jgi:hypothetical protein
MMKFIVSGGVTEFQDGNPAEENDIK